MEAIVRADGRQIRVAEGMEFETNRVARATGETVEFDVLMLLDGEEVTVGTPTVEGATVRARVSAHGFAPKLRFMKYKNKTRYRRKIGHRQPVSRLVVESITKG